MVNNIIKESEMYSVKYHLIDRYYVDQFVVAILSWYRSYQPISFYDDETSHTVPNVFHLFEYPTPEAEYVLNLFVKSDVYKTAKEKNMDFADGELMDKSLTTYNECFPDIYPYMLDDVMTVLDIYRLFYCFQDDATTITTYYNPYLKELW